MSDVVKVYNYDSEGKITATGTMDLDVFKTVPVDATIVQPPKQEEELKNEVLRFDEVNEKWDLVADYRGSQYKDSDGNIHEISELGIEPKDTWVKYTPKSQPTEEEQRIADLEDALATFIGGGA
jgi:hypothetical protein